MIVPFVDLKKQYLSIKSEIDNAIQIVINEAAFIKGKYVKEFEANYANKIGVKYAISCANGTDAIYIALKSLGIGRGDEVITTSHSWISTSETISQTGATPVFVDTDPNYYTIDPNKIESKITKNTKAIIPVHLYGHPADMDNILDIAKNHNLRVIEDCAQAHFAKWNNKMVGTFGDVATFSFFPGKNLGAFGDAGCIITNNEELSEKIQRFSKHGALGKHDHEIEGINSRLDGIQAAILSVKLKYIDKWTELRIKNANIYTNLLAEIDEVKIPITHPAAKHVFHLFVIRTNKRDSLKKYLQDCGISTGIHYPVALPYLKAYNYLGYKQKDFPIAIKHSNEILSLPMFPELNLKQIENISNKICKYFHR